MKKSIIGLVFIALLCASVSLAYAVPVFDAANYALNTLRNALMENQHVEDMVETAKSLIELKNMVEGLQFLGRELIQKGFSEIESFFDGFNIFSASRPQNPDPFTDDFTNTYFKVLNENPYLAAHPEKTEQIQNWIQRAGSGDSLSYYLNLVPDPVSSDHQYITYEQVQITRSFEQADSLRKYADELSKEGEKISQAAGAANLLGAARLQAASMGKLYEILGTVLVSQGRLSELQSLSLEQVSRREKAQELERERVLQDMSGFVSGRPEEIDGVKIGGVL